MSGRLGFPTWASAFALLLLILPALAHAQPAELRGGRGEPITLVVRDAPVVEVLEMLARHESINVVISNEVEGKVSLSLFEVSPKRAIRGVAEAAGYVARPQGGGYLIVEPEEAGRESSGDQTIIRAFELDFADAEAVSEILQNHVSRFGQITTLPDRRMVVVEDLPDYVKRSEQLLADLDRLPQQILIEAKILEVSLEETEIFGIDWRKTFEALESVGDFGVRGLTSAAGPGLFFDLVTPDAEVMLTALSEEGRVRTLSTPTLLALEHQEAEVVIGDRLGFRVVTTINQVTSESVEFLESGVILRLTAAVDRDRNIVMEIHPEVSTGLIDEGLPEQTTTEVTTQLIARPDRTILIGGLIRDRTRYDETGLPFMRRVPVLRHFLSRQEDFSLRSETIVLVKAHIVDASDTEAASSDKTRWVETVDERNEGSRERLDESVANPSSPLSSP